MTSVLPPDPFPGAWPDDAETSRPWPGCDHPHTLAEIAAAVVRAWAWITGAVGCMLEDGDTDFPGDFTRHGRLAAIHYALHNPEMGADPEIADLDTLIAKIVAEAAAESAADDTGTTFRHPGVIAAAVLHTLVQPHPDKEPDNIPTAMFVCGVAHALLADVSALYGLTTMFATVISEQAGLGLEPL